MTACRRCSLGVAARAAVRRMTSRYDDLDDSTQLVLSMLSLASVVVDDQDEVVVPILRPIDSAWCVMTR